jgi:hypothetical protein
MGRTGCRTPIIQFGVVRSACLLFIPVYLTVASRRPHRQEGVCRAHRTLHRPCSSSQALFEIGAAWLMW